ncbi:MAG: PepSY-like domain-containing protein [Cyclobacteriaceae bacterium]
MKKLIPLLILILIWNVGWSQVKEPNSIPDKEVPKKVINKFKEKNPGATNAKWYPYPNRYWKSPQVQPVYLPIGWSNSSPDYYEVRFSDDRGALRKVYDRVGSLKVTSRPFSEADLPIVITDQLEKKGYAGWKRVNIERVSKSGEKGHFFKIWLRDKGKKRILFFDETGKIVKTLKWDDDTNLTADSDSRLKRAPDANRKIEPASVPQKVKEKVKKQYIDVTIIEWLTQERVYDPFDNEYGLSYYDLEIPAFYQVIIAAKKNRIIATYNEWGDLLEVAEIVSTKALPKAVRQIMKSDKYKLWSFEKQHNKIEMEDGSMVYRLFAYLKNEPVNLLLDGKGDPIN